MIVRRKNVYGDGTIEYEEYEIDESEAEDTDATEFDYITALQDLGVTLDA